ncbi:MAG TPA: RNase adapter RapZ [Verrucomicrobiae bacterium]|nr:RNase adapter RapZ [Verrucomicrobiae bacterium]
MKLVIISGLSGAGKTVALKQYEDLGFFCIDNLPMGLLGPLAQRSLRNERYARLAVGIDARASPREIARFPEILARQRERGVDCQVLFLTAHDDVILRRYSETRRKHPLTDAKLSLSEAISRERELLDPIANVADATLDTSDLNLHGLREAIARRQPDGARRLSLVLTSFGYKNGLPSGADYVFDVRWMPNPHWVPQLKPLDGRAPAVVKFLEKEVGVRQMTKDIADFLEAWLPRFVSQDRAYVTVAIGCTGGRHRSVYVVEKLAAALRGQYDPVVVKHKELS